MACTITNLAPLGRPCTPQMGGIKYLYLLSAPRANGSHISLYDGGSSHVWLYGGVYDEDTDYTFKGWGIFAEEDSEDATTPGELDTIMRGLGSGGLVYYFERIDVTRQGAVVTSELQHNKENGSDYYLNSVVIPTAGLTPEVVDLLRKLGTGGCVVVAETYTGQLVAFGFEERAILSDAAVTTGANWGDMPGATITLSAEEKYPVAPDVNLCSDDTYYLYGPSGIAPVFKEWFTEHV